MMTADMIRPRTAGKVRSTPAGPPSTDGPSQTAGRLGNIGLLALLAVAVAGITLAVHWPVLDAKALSFDDQMYLTDNYLVQNPSWSTAKRFMAEVIKPSTVRGYYQPLTMISLMLDAAQGGTPENLRPFHRTSLLLHAANTVLVIVLLYQLFGKAWIATAVGLLFGLHPMTVEPVAWVGDRKTLLCAIFALGSVIAYVRYTRVRSATRWAWYIGALAMYAAALLAKPTATLLPVALILLDFWPLKRVGGSDLPEEKNPRSRFGLMDKSRTVGRHAKAGKIPAPQESGRSSFGLVKSWLVDVVRGSVLEKTPFLLVTAVSAVITCISQGATAEIEYGSHRSPLGILLVLCYDTMFYPLKMLWPMNLTSHYPYPEPMNLSNPVLIAALLGTLGLLVGLVVSLRWTRALVCGWLVFFLLILPTMGVIGFTNVPASDKYAYLPAIGLLMVLAWGLDAAQSRLRGRRRLALGAFAVVMLGVCTAESIRVRDYLPLWSTSERLCRHMLTLAPHSATVYKRLAVVLLQDNKPAEAIEACRRSIELEPGFADAYTGLGIALTEVGRFNEAITAFHQSLERSTRNAEAFASLGTAMAQLGSLDEAYANFESGVALQPENPKIHYNYGIALATHGRLEDALAHFRKSIAVNPRSAKCQYNIGLTLANLRRYDEAVVAYEQALKLDPANAVTMNNLGNACAAQNKLDDAVGWYERALRLQTNYAQAHSNLALALIAQHRIADAIAHLERALELEPDNALTQQRLGAARQLLDPSSH